MPRYNEVEYPGNVRVRCTSEVFITGQRGAEKSVPPGQTLVLVGYFPDYYVLTFDDREYYAEISEVDQSTEPI